MIYYDINVVASAEIYKYENIDCKSDRGITSSKQLTRGDVMNPVSMNIDIRKLRKDAKIAQKELASRVKLPQGTISRYESHPETIPFTVMIEILNALGTSVAELLPVQIPKITPLDCGEPFQDYLKKINNVRQHVEQSSEPGAKKFFAGALSTERLKDLVVALDRKPNVLFAGPSDAGKTTIINTLLGQPKLLPTTYQSTTGVVTYIRHISDKPNWLKKTEKEDVLLLGPGFEPWMLHEEIGLNDKGVISGNIRTFKDYCTADGKRWKPGKIRSALVFIDAPILQSCNMIDMPGFDSELLEDFTDTTNDFSFEILIYASPYNGFLRSSEVVFLFNLIRQMRVLPDIKGLDTLYVLITHASISSISEEDVGYLKKRVSERLFTLAEYDVFRRRIVEDAQKYSEIPGVKTVEERIFTFWQEDHERWSDFSDDLMKLLSEKLIVPMTEAARLSVWEVCQKADKKLSKLREYCLRVLNMKKPHEADSIELIESEPARRKRLLRKKQSIVKQIEKLRLQFIRDFRKLFSEVVCQSNIIATLQTVEGPKEAGEMTMLMLLNQLRDKTESVRMDLYSSISELIDDVFDVTHDIPSVFKGGFNASDAFLFGVEQQTGFEHNISYTQSIVSANKSNPHSIFVDPRLLDSGLVEQSTPQRMLPVSTVMKLSEEINRITTKGVNWRQSYAKKAVRAFETANFLEEVTAANNSIIEEATGHYLAGVEELIDHWKDFFQTQKALLIDYEKTSKKLDRLLDDTSEKIRYFEKIPLMLK